MPTQLIVKSNFVKESETASGLSRKRYNIGKNIPATVDESEYQAMHPNNNNLRTYKTSLHSPNYVGSGTKFLKK